ncbi:hypothetical protein ACQVP2_29470 [Methylobacterium aquaticum]|uniref:hypothetical protein n=1 Tax=Methylobacterium aquaticum TaxID=270351 RepID=UPI003D175B8C
MTPLAQRIARESLLPAKKQIFYPDGGSIPDLAAAPCFEVTDVWPLICQLASDVDRITDGPATSFLPAPRFWAERRNTHHRGGMGMLIEHTGEPDVVNLTTFHDGPEQDALGETGRFVVRLTGDGAGLIPQAGDECDAGWNSGGFGPQNLLPALLLVINSPRVIARETQPPHRGLEKDLRAARREGARFKLLPWTKIRLNITPPAASGETGEGGERITGAKALHFCRSHIRVRLGRLEIVKAHWRGDPELGIRRPTYAVTGEQTSAPG